MMQFATIKLSQFSQHKMENKLKTSLFYLRTKVSLLLQIISLKQKKTSNCKTKYNTTLRLGNKNIFHTTFQNRISQKRVRTYVRVCYFGLLKYCFFRNNYVYKNCCYATGENVKLSLKCQGEAVDTIPPEIRYKICGPCLIHL